jgi:hypothetical protein
MAQQPSRPIGDSISQQYRVLVTVRPGSRPRDFIWQIVRNAAGGELSVRLASTVTFKTMNEAYDAGAAALKKLPPS